ASLLNARLVGRYGMRQLSHAALLGAVVVNVVHVLFALVFGESFWVFFALMAATMFAMGLVISNFNALALEPLGRIAGTASAAFGFITTTSSAIVGGVIGQFYNGTATPMVLGFAGATAVGVLIVLATEKGVLFRAAPPQHEHEHG
ncbi:MAG: hypothetical protein PVI23_13870, partial [Maricaulaceae bacterium]